MAAQSALTSNSEVCCTSLRCAGGGGGGTKTQNGNASGFFFLCERTNLPGDDDGLTFQIGLLWDEEEREWMDVNERVYPEDLREVRKREE